MLQVISNIIPALKSRFFVIDLEPYTYEQFYEITVRLLTNQHKVKEEIARATADAVWNRIKSADIRDSVRVARMANFIEDVNFIVDSFLKYKVSINIKKTQIKYLLYGRTENAHKRVQLLLPIGR